MYMYVCMPKNRCRATLYVYNVCMSVCMVSNLTRRCVLAYRYVRKIVEMNRHRRCDTPARQKTYTCTCMHILTYTCTCMHILTYTCTCMHILLINQTYTCTCMHILTYTCTCMHILLINPELPTDDSRHTNSLALSFQDMLCARMYVCMR